MITQKLAFVCYQRDTKFKIIYAEISAPTYLKLIAKVKQTRKQIIKNSRLNDGTLMKDVTVVMVNLKNAD